MYKNYYEYKKELKDNLLKKIKRTSSDLHIELQVIGGRHYRYSADKESLKLFEKKDKELRNNRPKNLEELMAIKSIEFYYSKLNKESKEIVSELLKTRSMINTSGNIRGYRPTNCYRDYSGIFTFIESCYYFQELDFDPVDYLNLKKYFEDDRDLMLVPSSYFASLISSENNGKLLEKISNMIYESEGLLSLSRELIGGMLFSTSEEAHNMIMDLLKTAKLSEGLRQSIVEQIDLAEIEVYKRFLEYMNEENLYRFSSVKRAYATYTGLAFNIDDSSFALLPKGIYDCLCLGKTEEYLESKSPLDIYLGLYAMACYDLNNVFEFINEKFSGLEDYKKGACLLFLSKCNYQVTAKTIMHTINNTQNPNLLAHIFTTVLYEIDFVTVGEKEELIKLVSKNLDFIKKGVKKYQVLDEKHKSDVNLSQITKKILKYSHDIDDLYEESYKHFEKIVHTYNLPEEIFSEIRVPYMKTKLISLIGSNGSDMRAYAAKVILQLEVEFTDDEYITLAHYLKSKRSDTRRHVCNIIKSASSDVIINCCEELLKDKNVEKKKGAIDILIDNREKVEKNGSFTKLKEIIKEVDFPEEYKANASMVIGEVVNEIAIGVDFYDKDYMPDIAILRYDKKIVSKFFKPDENKLMKFAKEVISIHESLIGVDFVKINYDGSKTTSKFGFEYNQYIKNYNYGFDENTENYKKYCFYEKFLHLENEFSHEELISCKMYFKYMDNSINYERNSRYAELFKVIQRFDKRGYYPKYKKTMKYLKSLNDDLVQNYIKSIDSVLSILIGYKSTEGIETKSDVEFFLNLYSYIIEKQLNEKKSIIEATLSSLVGGEKTTAREGFVNFDRSYHEKAFARKDRKYCFEDDKYAMDVAFTAEGLKNKKINGIDETLLIHFIEKKLLKEDYIYKWAFDFEEHQMNRYRKASNSENMVGNLSGLIKGKIRTNTLDENEVLFKIYTKIIDSMLETELERTETDSKYSKTLNKANIFFGVNIFLKAVFKMGKMPFVRGYSLGLGGKKDMFSHIISKTKILQTDNQENFDRLVDEYKIPDKKLLEATMYNLEFINFTENNLKIKGLKKAAYYFKAHMNDYFSESEKTLIRRYSDIDIEDLKNGQMDLEWFKNSYRELGKKRFMEVYDSAKYITSGGNHKRAQYFADAVLGNIKESDVLERIDDKRNQDMILCYGLVPLKRNKTKAALTRYKRLQLFLKESKKFGAQRKASEGLKVSIAMNNLARNYGFNDVNRFVWNMETELIEDIREVFESKIIGEITVYISVENPESPEIIVYKNEKKLKNVPAKYKKHEYTTKLKEVKKDLKEQYKRAKYSLEDAMINEEVFKVSEILNLFRHPVIGGVLKNLLFICDDEVGFIVGNTLKTLESEIVLSKDEKIIIAHPSDLKRYGIWTDWQSYIIDNQVKQPFKQVFRELYVMTKDEVENDGYTNRFAGYQVEGRRMMGIMKSRGWMVNEMEGFEKINHKSDLRIDLYCYADWFTPGEVESPSMEKVVFMNNKTGKTMDMKKLSKTLFSETMRDIDLVVSVAYVGGVDVMLNHSTIEMRSRIIEHNLSMFKIKNYSMDKHHITINGQYGNYSVHLGSGIIHMEGRGMLPVFPVNSQHRGHIFLPFVDEDPKTAEIITKVLMLAKDGKIKDPSILCHLR